MSKKTVLKDNEATLTRKICEIQSQIEYLPLEKIKNVLKEKFEKGIIKRYAYCLHDKDKKDDGSLKKPHYHIYLSFKDAQPFSRVATWFNLDKSYVRIIKTNYDTACAYLIHRNNPEKHQYGPNEVTASFDYPAFLKNLSEAEKKSIDIAKKRQTIEKKIRDMVQTGILRGYNFHEYFSYEECLAYRSYLEKAVKEVIDEKIFKNDERNLEVIYISGDSGTGKTSYAKEIARKRKFYYAVSAEDRDPLEAYQGQPCIILDEIRPDSLKLANFLKLIDNHTESRAGARYHGKTLIECQLIIITSIRSIEDFFCRLQENDKETAVQIMRRCKTKIAMEKNILTVDRWDDGRRAYVTVMQLANPIADKFDIKEKPFLDLKQEAGDILGLGFDDLQITVQLDEDDIEPYLPKA